MDTSPTTVLVIAEHPGAAPALEAALRAATMAEDSGFSLVAAVGPVEGLSRLETGGVDVLLLDASGTSDATVDTLRRIRERAPEVPVVLVTPPGTPSGAFGALPGEAGAQDALSRDQLQVGDLHRVLRYAIERHRLQATLRQLALSDELTGLYNRRGFFALCEHHLKLAHRMRGLMLAVLDVDQLRAINGRFGREEGDRALLGAAAVLRGTFRASDVIARLAGDDFAVLVLDATEDAVRALEPRLRERLERHNAEPAPRGYALSLSMGLVRCEPHALPPIEELLVHAGERLAEAKRRPVAGA